MVLYVFFKYFEIFKIKIPNFGENANSVCCVGLLVAQVIDYVMRVAPILNDRGAMANSTIIDNKCKGLILKVRI